VEQLIGLIIGCVVLMFLASSVITALDRNTRVVKEQLERIATVQEHFDNRAVEEMIAAETKASKAAIRPGVLRAVIKEQSVVKTEEPNAFEPQSADEVGAILTLAKVKCLHPNIKDG
jgi:hypothetical protein